MHAELSSTNVRQDMAKRQRFHEAKEDLIGYSTYNIYKIICIANLIIDVRLEKYFEIISCDKMIIITNLRVLLKSKHKA